MSLTAAEHKKIDDQILYLILYHLENCNDQGYKKEDFYFDTKTLEIFPSVPKELNGKLHYVDEQANRFGIALIDMHLDMREHFYIPDFCQNYEERTEFQLFEDVQSIFDYFKREVRRVRTDWQ